MSRGSSIVCCSLSAGGLLLDVVCLFSLDNMLSGWYAYHAEGRDTICTMLGMVALMLLMVFVMSAQKLAGISLLSDDPAYREDRCFY